MSFMDNGRDTRGKMLLQSMRVEEGEFHLFFLSDRHIQALLSITEYLRWVNRYNFLPDDLSIPNALRSWVDDLEDRLMHPYREEGNMPIDCADVLACVLDALNNNNTFKNQVADKLAPQILNTNNYNNYITNQPYPTPTNTLVTPSNNHDIIWAQSVAIVEFTHNRIMGIMAILEVQGNNIEVLQNVEAIPLLGTLMDEMQLDTVLEFIDYALSIWQEQYAANWTEDPPTGEEDPDKGTKWVLSCALFCLVKDDGVFTVDRVNQAFRSLFTSSLPASDNLAEIIQFLIGLNDDNALVVYGSFIAVWGIATLTSRLVNDPITDKLLNAILRLAVNDANSDWELYCFECAPSDTIGFMVYGTIGATTVVQQGNTFTITGGFQSQNKSWLYVGHSINGSPISGGAELEYTDLTMLNYDVGYDWGDENGNYTSHPPLNTPPKVQYFGGAGNVNNISTLTIIFTTNLPYQGLIQGV